MDITAIKARLNQLQQATTKTSSLWKPSPGKTQVRIDHNSTGTCIGSGTTRTGTELDRLQHRNTGSPHSLPRLPFRSRRIISGLRRSQNRVGSPTVGLPNLPNRSRRCKSSGISRGGIERGRPPTLIGME